MNEKNWRVFTPPDKESNMESSKVMACIQGYGGDIAAIRSRFDGDIENYQPCVKT